MPELTDAQKVNREVTQKRIATALETLAQNSEAPIGLGMTGATAGQVPVVKTVDANGVPTSYEPGAGGGGSGGLPSGGTDGDVLVKNGATDYAARWEKPQYYRPNLLDNWYFVGGGSQLGYGTFPINQRGQTSYSNIGYTIDRWKIGQNIIMTVSPSTVSSSGITLSNVGLNNEWFYALIPESQIPDGEYTGSMIVSAYTGTYEFVLQEDGGNWQTVFSQLLSSTGLSTATGTKGNATQPTYRFGLVLHPGASITIQAVKLELGSEQTLCHNEGTSANPVWVLNEIPDYGEELLKCQRYFQTFRTEALRPTYGADCRPVMATEQPTKGTITVSGSTIYTLES